MQLIKATILTLILFSELSSAQPSCQSSSTDGLQLQLIDDSQACPIPALEATNNANTTTSIPTWLIKYASTAFTLTTDIATSIWAWSQPKNCSSLSGIVNGWQYEYHTAGWKCDTTAQQKAIQGAIDRFLEMVDDKEVCGTQCLSLPHGDSWAGYLKYGKEGSFDDQVYCGPTLHFEYCASGV